MANLNDFSARFRHGISNPFTSFGLEWCPRCKTEVDCDTQAVHQGTTYAYKRWCLRCGKVIKRGVYDCVPLVGGPLPAAALEWTTTPGQDRR
jgi:hypothetical protein